mgnify:CR=1 FL=1
MQIVLVMQGAYSCTLSIVMANVASVNHEDSGAFWTFTDSLLVCFVVTECVATVDFSGCGPLTDICAWDDGRSVIVYPTYYSFQLFAYSKQMCALQYLAITLCRR